MNDLQFARIVQRSLIKRMLSMSEITPEHQLLMENHNLTLTLLEVANMQPLKKAEVMQRLVENNRVDKAGLIMLIEVCKALISRQTEIYMFSNGEQVEVVRLHKALNNLLPLIQES